MELSGFIGGAYTDRTPLVDMQECVNWYPEVTNANAKAAVVLKPTPGLVLFSGSSGDGPVRDLYLTGTGRLFAVSYNKLEEILSTGTRLERGMLSTSDGRVSMSDNGVQLIVVDGSHGYLLNLDTNFWAEIEDSDFPRFASHVSFINGRFVVNKTNTNQYNLWWSALYDGSSWDGLDVISAEGFADKLIALLKVGNQLWLFGEQSTEVFYDTGDADAPYQRISGAFFDIGTGAKYSPATIGNTAFWLGSNALGQGTVWMSESYHPVRISTHAIEYIIGTLSRIDDAIGYCYQQHGHTFYVLTFPTGNRTLVYDVTTGFWHERASYNNASDTMLRYIGACCCAAFGKVLIGSCKTSDVFQLDPEVFTENGSLIRRVRVSPHIHDDMKRVFYTSFELDAEKGAGLNSGQGDNPRFMLQWSDDGGYTWSNEYWQTAGRIGQYKTRIIWRRLGASRDRLFRVVYTDPTSCTLVRAHISVAEGTS